MYFFFLVRVCVSDSHLFLMSDIPVIGKTKEKVAASRQDIFAGLFVNILVFNSYYKNYCK